MSESIPAYSIEDIREKCPFFHILLNKNGTTPKEDLINFANEIKLTMPYIDESLRIMSLALFDEYEFGTDFNDMVSINQSIMLVGKELKENLNTSSLLNTLPQISQAILRSLIENGSIRNFTQIHDNQLDSIHTNPQLKSHLVLIDALLKVAINNTIFSENVEPIYISPRNLLLANSFIQISANIVTIFPQVLNLDPTKLGREIVLSNPIKKFFAYSLQNFINLDEHLIQKSLEEIVYMGVLFKEWNISDKDSISDCVDLLMLGIFEMDNFNNLNISEFKFENLQIVRKIISKTFAFGFSDEIIKNANKGINNSLIFRKGKLN
jgi:hypothetical protein